MSIKPRGYILVIHYRHESRHDDFFYITKEQIGRHHLENSAWGDLVFNKPERDQFVSQTLADLARRLLNGEL